MTAALSTNLSATPIATPAATLLPQLAGRAKPIALHGVRERHVQTSAAIAPSGGTSAAASTTRTPSRPTGPKPRSPRASASSGAADGGSAAPALIADSAARRAG